MPYLFNIDLFYSLCLYLSGNPGPYFGRKTFKSPLFIPGVSITSRIFVSIRQFYIYLPVIPSHGTNLKSKQIPVKFTSSDMLSIAHPIEYYVEPSFDELNIYIYILPVAAHGAKIY